MVGGVAGRLALVLVGDDVQSRTVGPGPCPDPGTVELPGEPTSVVLVDDRHAWVQLREPAALVLVDVETLALVANVVLAESSVRDTGHVLFHRPTERLVACVSCHPEGREDGRVWSFSNLGARRTQALDIGLEGTEPFHWRGELADVAAVVEDTFRSRMGGPFLSEDHVAALERWIFALPPLTMPPPTDPATVERGRERFEALGCGSCHADPGRARPLAGAEPARGGVPTSVHARRSRARPRGSDRRHGPAHAAGGGAHGTRSGGRGCLPRIARRTVVRLARRPRPGPARQASLPHLTPPAPPWMLAVVARPILHGTPRSHFTRVVRITAHELGLELEWVDVGNVATAEAFADNPLMQVPVLVDGDRTVWDSHDICRYLVEREDADPLGMESLDWSRRNLVSVIRGVMSAEVRLILAERSGMSTTGPMFDKARETIRRGLRWIDARIEGEVGLSYPAVCAVAMWDHLLLYDNAERGEAPRIDAVAMRLGAHDSVARTRPS